MDTHVLVTLLEPVVLADIVEVLAANDDGALHLHLLHDAGQDPATNRHVTGERTLLVDVHARNRLCGI